MIDFSGQDLKQNFNKSFKEANLKGKADLSSANMMGCDLSFANQVIRILLILI